MAKIKCFAMVGKSINKASKGKTMTREGSKQGLKSVDFSGLFRILSHSKTACRGSPERLPPWAETGSERLVQRSKKWHTYGCAKLFRAPQTGDSY